ERLLRGNWVVPHFARTRQICCTCFAFLNRRWWWHPPHPCPLPQWGRGRVTDYCLNRLFDLSQSISASSRVRREIHPSTLPPSMGEYPAAVRFSFSVRKDAALSLSQVDSRSTASACTWSISNPRRN